MKRYFVLLLVMFFSVCLKAQQQADYNRKGDEAMDKKEYFDALSWYGEGIEYCDMYSIKQLIRIWQENETMRTTMRYIMEPWFACLNEKATENDLAAITQLIIFHREGIGTEKSEAMAAQWESRKVALETPRIDPAVRPESRESFPREHIRFFAGYAFSTEMPFGLTVGGIQNRVGWYARVKTNFSFMNSEKEYELTDAGSIVIVPEKGKAYQVNRTKGNRKNSIAGTAGFILKTSPWLYLSAGAGYGERTLLTPFSVIDIDTAEKEGEIWCRNKTYSYKGVMVEADAMFKHKNFFFSVGCHTMNFDYADVNVGIGVFF